MVSSSFELTPTSAAALRVLVRSVRPLSRRLLAMVEDRLAGSGLSVPLRDLLERLYEGGAQTVPALSRAQTIPRQFAQRLVDEGARDGLLERVPNAAHRRSPLIKLTDRGRAVIEGVLASEEAALEALAARLDADDVDAATRVLAGLAAGLAGLSD